LSDQSTPRPATGASTADAGDPAGATEPGTSPPEPRTYDGAAVAGIVRDRLGRQARAHQEQLSAVAEQAASAAIARAREQHELELGQIFHDLGLEPGDLHRIRRERRAFERAAENGAFRRGPRALKMRIG
jgi:hypothetical protein